MEFPDPPWLNQFRASTNSFLSQYEPLTLLLSPLFALLLAQILQSFFLVIHERGLKATIISFVMSSVKLVPGVNKYIDAEKQKIVDKLQASGNRDGWKTELPRSGLGNKVLEQMKDEKQKDVTWQGKCSGTVYIGGNEHEGHFSLINEACSMFAHTNPLHLSVFPSVVRFEAEVVAMTAALLGSKEKTSGGQICGNMTSGGTESILLAVKSSRDYMKAKKGITKPEMIIPVSAHSAYDKAAQYFKIKLWRVPVDKEFRADVKAVNRHINKNTIMIVGSAPGFPHGIIDPIEDLGDLASSYGICLHVDLCLGGFVLPFARKLGYPVPPFDFTVQGVTSISVDVHKYGLAPKGTSVVLYRNHEIRKHQFVAVTEWTGGLYVSPTIAGSRPGGLIAGAWAAMISLGFEGYLENTREIMEASKSIQKGIQDIPELFIIGRPDMSIIAFGSDVVDIFEVNDVMSSKGWHLNALQRPNSVHICVTLQHVPVVQIFLKDLRDSVQTVKENPGPVNGGFAPIYGAAGKMPDRGMVQDLLIEFMDSSC
ncbi:PREDICTED: sphingosine-1-phosphate lyase isoform X1 [Nicotiana attenuata]|uniref:Sphingosine-1-phosphate lyase n=1 Tax=Nicotiana attenuata TaxID=49451 RepID=A0A1J6I9D2_NICAT|nr:PREDICTED: sphingosine-1-phosphate lyase isoform X1 [Nicotiana attenuata]OIT01629.1 sphingosine-1-phosphate lyase [Nicotiana attenuata]